MDVADVPAVQVEVGEQEDHQSGRQDGLGRGAPDSLAFRGDAEELAHEAEIDAEVGEHGPGQRRRGGEDHGPFTTKTMERNSASSAAMPTTTPR